MRLLIAIFLTLLLIGCNAYQSEQTSKTYFISSGNNMTKIVELSNKTSVLTKAPK